MKQYTKLSTCFAIIITLSACGGLQEVSAPNNESTQRQPNPAQPPITPQTTQTPKQQASSTNPRQTPLTKNADGVTVSTLPFDSEAYMKCADIFMKQTYLKSSWQGFACKHTIYFLSSEERLMYVDKDALGASNGNGVLLPTQKEGSLVTIATTSEGDEEDSSTLIVIKLTSPTSEYDSLYIDESKRFVIDNDYVIKLYDKQSGKLIQQGPLEELMTPP